MGSRRSLCAALAALSWVVSGAPLASSVSAAGLEAGTDAAAAGRYADALSALDRCEPDARQACALLRASVLESIGRDDAAEAILVEEASGRRATQESRAAYGEFLVMTGRFELAVEVLDPAVEGGTDPHPAARYWRALAFERMGRRSRARLEYEDFIRDYNRGRARTPESLRAVAMACHRLGLFADANAAFREALEQSPDDITTRLRWAELFIEKYRPDEARRLLDEVLVLNPNQPQALALRAQAELSLSYDITEAVAFAERALAVHPDLPEALEVLASVALDDLEIPQALELLDRGARRRPSRVETVALIGAAHHLADDERRFQEIESTLVGNDLAVLYHTTAELAVRHFRYSEGLALHTKALEADASFWPAYVSLGIGYSRLGDDARALQFLRRAFDADPFNVQAFNMVELWEGALAEYRYIDDVELRGLRYRFHRDEQDVLSRYIPDAVRNTFRVYTARYGFEPEPPLSIEVFADPSTFGVRSIGLPFAPQHGICFGHVITSRSPSSGDFNWRQTLEHELSHVFSLQLSRYRVPRWFTEGLAEYDTIQSRAEWRRTQDLAMVRSLQAGTLIGVGGLNRAFVAVERPEQVLEAYYQASLVVEFISERWGGDAVIAMLRGWGESRSTEAVFSDVLGVGEEEFDVLFEGEMRRRYADQLALVEPATWMFSDRDGFLAAVESRPGDPRALADLAWAEAHVGDLAEAVRLAERALELDPRLASANLLVGHVAYGRRDRERAAEVYAAVVEGGYSSYTASFALGRLARHRGDLEAAEHYLVRAAALLPRDPEVRRELADLYERAGDREAAARMLLELARLDPNDVEPPLAAARHHFESGDLEVARELADMAVNIAPFDSRVHVTLGRIAHAQEDWETAIRELELVGDETMSASSSLRELLADAYRGTGRHDEAGALLDSIGAD